MNQINKENLVEVYNGHLLIADNGDVYTNEEDPKLLPTYKLKRKNYTVVAPYINSKQHHVYVHRLFAEAFVEKKSPKHTWVVAVDGDVNNFKVDNFIWMTPSEFHEHYKHIHRSDEWVQENGVKCPRCGVMHRKNKTRAVCKDCRAIVDREKAARARKEKRYNSTIKYVNMLDNTDLNEDIKNTYKRWASGESVRSIATSQNVSQQSISGKIKRVEYKINTLI